MRFFELIALLLAGVLGKSRSFPAPLGTMVIVVRRLIPSWAGAQTWGRVILLKEGENWKAHWPHEYVHTLQWRRWGALFPLAYLFASIVALARGGNPYLDNAFEVEARERAGEFVRYLDGW